MIRPSTLEQIDLEYPPKADDGEDLYEFGYDNGVYFNRCQRTDKYQEAANFEEVGMTEGLANMLKRVNTTSESKNEILTWVGPLFPKHDFNNALREDVVDSDTPRKRKAEQVLATTRYQRVKLTALEQKTEDPQPSEKTEKTEEKTEKTEDPKPNENPEQKTEDPKPSEKQEKTEDPKPNENPEQKTEDPKPSENLEQKTEDPNPSEKPEEKTEGPKPSEKPQEKTEDLKPSEKQEETEDPKPSETPEEKTEDSNNTDDQKPLKVQHFEDQALAAVKEASSADEPPTKKRREKTEEQKKAHARYMKFFRSLSSWALKPFSVFCSPRPKQPKGDSADGEEKRRAWLVSIRGRKQLIPLRPPNDVGAL